MVWWDGKSLEFRLIQPDTNNRRPSLSNSANDLSFDFLVSKEGDNNTILPEMIAGRIS